MMEKERLRKADIFSGTIVMLVGVMIISQAMQMPMKDSYGGVQNVWYVSPALFPLLVGSMLLFLGGGLVRTALKAVGMEGAKSVIVFFFSAELLAFLKQADTIRYYGIVFNLLVFVFLFVPRVDFFLAAVFFLLVLFCMYYCGDDVSLLSLLRWELLGVPMSCLFLYFGLLEKITLFAEYPADWMVLFAIFALLVYSARLFSSDLAQLRRFKLSVIISLVAPFTVGIIFKYFLMVPMPFEGLVVKLLDAIWYAELWS